MHKPQVVFVFAVAFEAHPRHRLDGDRLAHGQEGRPLSEGDDIDTRTFAAQAPDPRDAF